jgi:hypothetical protein
MRLEAAADAQSRRIFRALFFVKAILQRLPALRIKDNPTFYVT